MFSLKFVQANIFLFVSRYFALIQFFSARAFSQLFHTKIAHRHSTLPKPGARIFHFSLHIDIIIFITGGQDHAPFLPSRRRRRHHQGGGHLAPRFSPFIAATRASTGRVIFFWTNGVCVQVGVRSPVWTTVQRVLNFLKISFFFI